MEIFLNNFINPHNGLYNASIFGVINLPFIKKVRAYIALNDFIDNTTH